MSKISRFFKGGGSAASKGRAGPSPQEALSRLRETEEMLSKKQQYLEARIERELAVARQHGTRNRRAWSQSFTDTKTPPKIQLNKKNKVKPSRTGLNFNHKEPHNTTEDKTFEENWNSKEGFTAALQALKRKKRYEKQLSQIDGTLSTIEFQREALENSHTNTEVLKNMGYAAQAMKKVHENMDLNKIDDLMQDITEQQDVAQEISDAISNRATFGDEFDEDELMAELEELEQEELNKGMRDVRLPSVPSTSLPSRPASTRRRAEDEDEMKKLAAWAS